MKIGMKLSTGGSEPFKKYSWRRHKSASQNVTDAGDRILREEAEKARNKAMEGIQKGSDN